jgi:O-glycosyl hydrolase
MSLVVRRRQGRTFALVGALFTLSMGLAITLPTHSANAQTYTATVNDQSTYQTISGFGVSEPIFGELPQHQPPIITTDPYGALQADEALSTLLFSDTASNAGLTILQLYLPSTSCVDSQNSYPCSNPMYDNGTYVSIEPNMPSGGASGPPNYLPLGYSQLQEFLASGVENEYPGTQFIAFAASPPGFMKNNGTDYSAGTLCGEVTCQPTVGETCSPTGCDWRSDYANYLAQYALDYQKMGIDIELLGFENEPDRAEQLTQAGGLGALSGVSSMALTASQSKNFIDNYLAPALKSAGLSTRVDCCATASWGQSANAMANQYMSALGPMAGGIPSDPNVGAFTGHGYSGTPPNAPLNSPPSTSAVAPGWETEWSTFDKWDANWYESPTSPTFDATGFKWAENIYTGLTSANMSAFLYWLGVATPSTDPTSADDNESLVMENVTGSGSNTSITFTESGRFWAFANYSRFVRPEAVRIGATSNDTDLDLTAFKNTDGSEAVVALNTDANSITVNFSLRDVDKATATPYLTDQTSDTAMEPVIPVSGGSFSASLPADSLVTYDVVPAPHVQIVVHPCGPGQCKPPDTVGDLVFIAIELGGLIALVIAGLWMIRNRFTTTPAMTTSVDAASQIEP